VTVTLTFNPEVGAGLLAKAKARGMVLQDYLQKPRRARRPAAIAGSHDAEATPREEAVYSVPASRLRATYSMKATAYSRSVLNKASRGR
jgi:hypothetical protein